MHPCYGDHPSRIPPTVVPDGQCLYRTLPVVAQGKVLWIDDPGFPAAFTRGTVLGLDYALEQLLPQVTALVPQ
ncbi:MAG: hypothetical protein AB7J32_03390 [Pseudonocardia sp.]